MVGNIGVYKFLIILSKNFPLSFILKERGHVVTFLKFL